MHALLGIGMEASCGMWCIGGIALGNGDVFLPYSKGR